MPKSYECVICTKRTKPHNRRPLQGDQNKKLRKHISAKFFITRGADSVICNTCRQKYYDQCKQILVLKEKSRPQITGTDPDYIPEGKRTKTSEVPGCSPRNITLPISSTGKGHATCFICKKPGPKLIVVPSNAPFDVFVENSVILPYGCRCCPSHLEDNNLNTDAIYKIDKACLDSTTDFNRTDLVKLIEEVRQIALRNGKTWIDFDSPQKLTDNDYFNLTGLHKIQFEDLYSNIKSVRNTQTRSARACLVIFLTKLRTGMSNKLLSTLFAVSKHAVRRAVAAMRKNFTYNHLGFGHITREDVINKHTRPLAKYLLKKGQHQHTTEEANTSRLVTKIRWVVESVNARVKQWKYFDRIIPNTQIPYLSDNVKIVSALCNKYRPPPSQGNPDEDELLAAKMLYLATQSNHLKERIEEENLDTRSRKSWMKSDAELNFPLLTDEQLRDLTLGVYQLKQARSYTKEHLNDCGEYDIQIHREDQFLIRVKLQSRHTSSKSYDLWIQYDDVSVLGWYCKCRAGARVVGTCCHVASVLWYLGNARYSNNFSNDDSWFKHIDDAADLPVLDESDSDEGENEP